MANFSEYFVDPAAGNDGTGDGLSDGTAWKTVAHALSTITRDATNGDRINVKSSGTDTITSNLPVGTYAATATSAAPLRIQGYTTTAGDGGIGAISGGGTVGIVSLSGFDHMHIQDMQLGGCGSADILLLDNDCTFFGCFFHDSTGDGIDVDNNCLCVNCRFEGVGDIAPANYALRMGASAQVYGNFIQTKSGGMSRGISVTADACVVGNIITDDGNFGLDIGITNTVLSGLFMFNSVFAAGSDGIGIEAGTTTCIGNIVEGFSGAGGAGYVLDGDNPTVAAFNAAFNNDTEYNQAGVGNYLFPDNPDNETLSVTGFAKSGAVTYANRQSYFSPVNTGNVLNGVFGLLSKGASQPGNELMTGDMYIGAMGAPILASIRPVAYRTQ